MSYGRSMAAYPGPRARLRGLRGLGQWQPGQGNIGGAPIVSTGPQPPSPSATTPALQTLLQTGAIPAQNPLDYVSPQAAIAAGLDQNTVMTAWTKALAAFPSETAAINAGIPAAVVTQLYQASRAYVAQGGGSWLDGSTFGIPNGLLLAGGMLAAGAVLWAQFGKEL